MFQIVKGLLGVTCFVLLTCSATSYSLRLRDNIEVTLNPTENGLKLIATRNADTLLTGTLNAGIDLSSMNCTIDHSKCEIGDSTLGIEPIDSGLRIVWETQNEATEFQDCFDMPEGVHWYGGPERRVQSWPIEKMTIPGSDPYVLKRADNFAVAERYWLNSKGVFIYLLENVPLFVDQNIANENMVCFIAKLQNPYINRSRNILDYRVVFDEDPKAAHLRAVNTFLGKPLEYLVGDEILVAPILVEGATSRKVYLPRGSWRDGNDNTILYEGPISLDYSADINTLPYFIKE